jgi:hypothetical protein
MSDARFRRIVDAFREENPGQALDAEDIRRRVIASLDRRTSSRRWRIAWMAPMAAVLAASAALAATGRIEVPRALHPRAWLFPGRAPAPAARDSGKSSVAEAVPTNIESARDDAPPKATLAQLPMAARELEATRGKLPQGRPAFHATDGALSKPKMLEGVAHERLVPPTPVADRPASLEAQAVSDPPTSDELERFRTARRVHERSDPASAIAAWETYLRAFPRGKLAIEARFNRALCLVKAGRTTEAREALVAFASGSFGSYRRTDARNLLRALDEQP